MASISGKTSGPIATQALIVVNGVLDTNIVVNRQQQAATAGPNSTIIGSNAIDAPRLGIEEGELLMMPTSAFNFSGQSASTRRPLVFSSFNGIPVEDKMSQDAFEDEYVWLGMAQNNTFPEGDPGGMGNGIAIKRGGSGTTFNNSTDTFCPGDVIGYRLPSVDPATREREVALFDGTRVGTSRWRPSKHTARLRKVTYDEITGQFDRAVARLLRDVLTVSVPERELATATGVFRQTDSVEEMAVLLKKAFNWAFLAAIATCVDRQLVTLTNFTATTPQSQLAELGVKLGLVDRGARGAAQDGILQDAYFRRVFKSSLSFLPETVQQDASDKLKRDLFASARPPPTFGQTGKRDNEYTQLMHVANTASADLVRMYGQCMNRFERTTIGTASTYAPPGSNLDYVLRP